MSEPDSTAVRVALWRALHLEADAAPHIIEDSIGLRLAAPAEGWRDRPDMNPEWTRWFRAAILSRARFIEDLIAEEAGRGVAQYVLLGAGLDTFAERRPELASKIRVFEVDEPGTQEWKRRRLVELGFGVPDYLRLVPVNFERGPTWLEQLAAAGFDRARPAVLASTGVTMYLTREAIESTLRQIASLAAGSTLAMTFMVPTELVEPDKRVSMEMAKKGAGESGHPWISFFTPTEFVAMARAAGFKDAKYVSSNELAERYFAGRNDGLRPTTGEELLVART